MKHSDLSCVRRKLQKICFSTLPFRGKAGNSNGVSGGTMHVLNVPQTIASGLALSNKISGF